MNLLTTHILSMYVLTKIDKLSIEISLCFILEFNIGLCYYYYYYFVSDNNIIFNNVSSSKIARCY